jgi:hypothetical protein
MVGVIGMIRQTRCPPPHAVAFLVTDLPILPVDLRPGHCVVRLTVAFPDRLVQMDYIRDLPGELATFEILSSEIWSGSARH